MFFFHFIRVISPEAWSWNGPLSSLWLSTSEFLLQSLTSTRLQMLPIFFCDCMENQSWKRLSPSPVAFRCVTLPLLFICGVVMLFSSVIAIPLPVHTSSDTFKHTPSLTPYTKKWTGTVKPRGWYQRLRWCFRTMAGKKDTRMTRNVRKAIHLISSGHVAMCVWIFVRS